jgi:hypothetical protein
VLKGDCNTLYLFQQQQQQQQRQQQQQNSPRKRRERETSEIGSSRIVCETIVANKGLSKKENPKTKN